MTKHRWKWYELVLVFLPASLALMLIGATIDRALTNSATPPAQPAPAVTSKTSWCYGQEIRVNDEGDCVVLAKALLQGRFADPLYTDDPVYTRQTADDVQLFRKIFSLPPGDNFDQQMWEEVCANAHEINLADGLAVATAAGCPDS